MIGSLIVITPERFESALEPIGVPLTDDEQRALEHVGRAIARRSIETGRTAADVFTTEFAGRPWSVREVPDAFGMIDVTISFDLPHIDAQGAG